MSRNSKPTKELENLMALSHLEEFGQTLLGLVGAMY